MPPLSIYQAVDSLAPGSAVSNCVLAVHRILRAHGYDSRIVARSREIGVESGKPSWLPHRSGRRLWIYHLAVGSPLTARIAACARRDEVILWYHNLTPPRYVQASDPWLAARLAAGWNELSDLASLCRGAIADSLYNAEELRACGYAEIEIVPPVFLDGRYQEPPAPGTLRWQSSDQPTWLCVGRLAPNKGQTEVIAAFHAYKRLSPEARLFLVGGAGEGITYRRWLENQIAFLGLRDAVQLLGQVSQAELNACYRAASCFVSMSEHEGFGVPLVESMYFDVPVIAYAAAAVPETLGSAGILVKERNPFLVAEIAHLLHSDEGFRQAILAEQRRRLADFAYEKVQARLLAALERIAGVATHKSG